MSNRRLPVYLLLDTSGSMRGEPIHAVNNGLQVLISALKQDPYALESAYLSLITFDIKANEIFPLTSLDQVQLPEITTPDSGPTFLGAALKLLVERIDCDTMRTTENQKKDWHPLLFIMTDGIPSDLQSYREAIPEIKKHKFGNIVACAAGPKAKQEYLKELTDNIVCLDTLDSSGFLQFFKFVSDIMAVGSRSADAILQHTLPSPPAEVRLTM